MSDNIFSTDNHGDGTPRNEDKSGVISPEDKKGEELNPGDPEVAKWMEKDHETVVQAKVNSDRYIKQLQAELAGLRDELTVRTSLEEYLEAQEERQNRELPHNRGDNSLPNEGDRSDEAPNKELTDSDGKVDLTKEVKEILERALSDRDRSASEDRNLAYVKEKATEALGPEYPYLFSQKAKELNLDKTYLQDMARSQPEVFLKLMLGESYQRAETGTPPQGTVSAEAHSFATQNKGQKGSHISDWDHLKKDPAQYWSPSVQNEIFAAAKKAANEGRTDFYERK